MEENWTSGDLADYINLIREEERERVFEEVMKKRLLKKVFQTPEGKLVLKDVLDTLKGSLGDIYNLVMDGVRKNVDEIEKRVNLLLLSTTLITRWADMLQKGEKHEKHIDRKGITRSDQRGGDNG